MKKVVLAIFSFFLVLVVNATEPVKPAMNANDILIPVGKTGTKISLAQLATIQRSELEALTGKKMSFSEKLSFQLTQKKLRKSISEDGTITNKKMNKALTKRYGPESGFHGIGFILGFLLGLLGVVLAYVINDDADKSNRVKWAWIGFGAAVVLWIVIYVALIASLT